MVVVKTEWCVTSQIFFLSWRQDVLCNIVQVGSSKISGIQDKHRQALLLICGIIG